MGNQLESNASNQKPNVPWPSLVDCSSNKSNSTTTSSLQLPVYDSFTSACTSPSSLVSRSVTPNPPNIKSETQSPKTKSMISTKIVQIAADFWNKNMNSLSFEQQLEMGVALYLGMMVKDAKIKQVFTKHFNQHDKNEKIERISLKFVNMCGWLIRTMLRNEINLGFMLSNLGSIHRTIGINTKYFGFMLESLHETFSYYFPNTYKVQEKYAMDYTFKMATKMMMGQTININDINDHYLKNLNVCLKSVVGRQYLFGYLQETICDEIVIYLKEIMKYKSCTTNKGRFMIARNIVEVSIDTKSDLNLNISYGTRQNTMAMMMHFENKFVKKEEFEIGNDIFEDVTHEVYKLILANHWNKFVRKIQNIHDNKF